MPANTIRLVLMFVRPTLSEIHAVLAAHSAVVVHFSGTPKGSGSNFDYSFPCDLEEVIAGRTQTGLSCSTVMPGDEFSDFSKANATGCIGVVLGLQTPHSLLDAHPEDCGTYMMDGVRAVPHARDMTSTDLDATIAGRTNGSYNEWVIADYHVIGLFAAEPYLVSTEVAIDYPDEVPDYERTDATCASFSSISLDALGTLFPGLPIYTFSNDGLLQQVKSDWLSVTHKALYP